MNECKFWLTMDKIDEVIYKWTPVQMCGKHGYMSRLDRKTLCFIGLNRQLFILGEGKPVSDRKTIKWLTRLYNDGYWSFEKDAFDEFPTNLPFNYEQDILQVGGQFNE